MSFWSQIQSKAMKIIRKAWLYLQLFFVLVPVRFLWDFGFQKDAKMWDFFGIVLEFFRFGLLGLLLASPWPPFGSLLASIGLPWASPWAPLASLWSPFGLLLVSLGLPLASILLLFCLALAFLWSSLASLGLPLACSCFFLAFNEFSDGIPML